MHTYKIEDCQMSISCFDPILPNFHFMLLEDIGKILVPYSRFSRTYISCLLEDIDPIFKISKNVHFMFSGRYWFHIQDFQEFIRRTFGIVRPHLFLTNSKVSMPRVLDFPEYKDYGLSCFLLISWCLQSWR